MNLKYKILWVDDDIESFRDLDYLTRINDYLAGLFFDPIIDTFETVSDAENAIESGRYDLILSDYNIDTDKGDDFIKFIRGNSVNTEILFYSAQSEFIDAAHALLQDRISFATISSSTAEGYRVLYNKIIGLIDYTVAKVQELPNVRGLVMTETSFLDKLMSDFIKDYLEKASQENVSRIQRKLFKHMSESVKGALKKNGCENSCCLKIEEKELTDVIHMRVFESSKKAYTVKQLIDIEEFDVDTENFFKDYLNNIITNRNNLAHAYSELRDGKEVLITTNPNEEILFDADKCAEIRSNILYYKKMLESLHSQLEAL